MATKQKTFPCLNFKVDVLKGFGECTCGFIQVDHKPEKRNQLKEAYLKHNKPLARNNTSGEDNESDLNDLDDDDDDEIATEACDKFKFDPTKPYDTCSCGFTKSDHEQAKIRREKEKAARQQREAEQLGTKSAREIAMERGVPCPDFEVDLSNTGSYGVCLCGFSRKDHQDFRASPDVWIQTKQGLTEPKPFI